MEEAMKLTKRVLALCLILAMWLSLTGCGADTTPTDRTETTASSTVVTTTVTTGGETSATITVDSAPVTVTVTKPAPSIATTAQTTTAAKPTTTTTVTTTTTKPTTTATTVSSADKQLVDRAFALAQGAKIEGVTLTGVVTSSQGYSEGYNNATFDLQVQGTDGAKTIYCYRVKPANASRPDVAVGDRLSLSGTIQNYKGTIEFYPAEYTHLGGGVVITTTTTTRLAGGAAIDEDGIYETKEDVALYLHTYGKLPKNFVTKSQYNSLGKPADKCCGGDRFYNKEGLLPNKAGRLYYECDIDTYGITSRGAKRIVYSNDGLIYYTGDHYGSFTLMYGTP